MVSFGLAELLVVLGLAALALVFVVFWLALAALRRTKRLERRMEEPGTARYPRP
jgi:hypothetical protein